MNEITWVLLTDGYYVKLFFFTDHEQKLHTYREADFENSSVITYNLITRHKKNITDGTTPYEAPDLESPEYVLNMVRDFLINKHEDNSFSSLVVIAPQQVVDLIKQIFPDTLRELIHLNIIGDYLNLPQDQLEDLLATNLPQAS